MRGEANPFMQSGRFASKKVHLGISGSVACYKAAELLRAWLELDIRVTVTLTAAARQFVSPLLFKALGAETVYADMFAEDDIFGHLEPGQAADAFAVVPATADILAKFASGLAHDMLSAQFLAFSGPVVLAPAMNPRMWQHFATRENVSRLVADGCSLVGPDRGRTACGEEGQGRLAGTTEIFLAVLKALSPRDMAGQKVLVTLGPTREPWDGVRFCSNPSSGLMGAALATAAWLRGAEVTAICGPVSGIFLPDGIRRVIVQTARQMFEASQDAWPEMDMGLFCAAVADFAPVCDPEIQKKKIGKASCPDGFCLRFEPNPDILSTLAKSRRAGQKILGFAAEITPDLAGLVPRARAKLQKKGADVLAANRVNVEGGAFGTSESSMFVLDARGREATWDFRPKADSAWDLLTWLLNF